MLRPSLVFCVRCTHRFHDFAYTHAEICVNATAVLSRQKQLNFIFNFEPCLWRHLGPSPYIELFETKQDSYLTSLQPTDGLGVTNRTTLKHFRELNPLGFGKLGKPGIRAMEYDHGTGVEGSSGEEEGKEGWDIIFFLFQHLFFGSLALHTPFPLTLLS